MSRTSPQGQAFIDRVVALPAGPGVTDQLHQALSPSLQQESDWRKLWATDRNNTTLQNPYLGLIDVFDAPVDIRTTRARVVADQVDLSAKYVMPVSEVNRRKEGTLCTVADMEEFKKNCTSCQMAYFSPELTAFNRGHLFRGLALSTSGLEQCCRRRRKCASLPRAVT